MLKPVIEIGVVHLRSRLHGASQDTYLLNPEAAQFTDAALAAWCDGDNFRWGESVERGPHEVRVIIYKD